jgi:hypothetical protein
MVDRGILGKLEVALAQQKSAQAYFNACCGGMWKMNENLYVELPRSVTFEQINTVWLCKHQRT